MTNEMFDSILDQLDNLIQINLVHPHYSLWLSSYNDILLDVLLRDRLSILRKHKKSFHVLTNGIGILKNSELIHSYRDVINGLTVNLPAGNPMDYSRYTKNDASLFDQIIEGLILLYEKSPDYYKKVVTIVVNGSYDDEIARSQMKYKLPDNDTNNQINLLRKIQPFKVNDARPLCDRAGLLRKVNIIDNQAEGVRELWKLPVNSVKASGCNGGNRLNAWIHINSKGDLYTCCQDFLEKYVYGSLLTSSLEELLTSHSREEMNELTLQNLCTQCWFSY